MRHIVVAGAGLGGLATALALARGGLHATVLERRTALATFGAGIQLAPNATRILARLGVLEAVRATAVEPKAVRIRRGRDRVELALLPLGPAALRRYGAPFLLLHRADLQGVLARAVAAAGAETRFDSPLEAAEPQGDGLRIVAGGRTLAADGLVDARGWREPAIPTVRRIAWRALLPADRVAAADRQPCSNLWLGPDTHLVHYPVRGGAMINVVAITAGHGGPVQGMDDPWSFPGDPAELRRAFAGWHPEAVRLLDPDAAWRCWRLDDAGPTGAWSSGATTRIGDAAHPMLPFLAQGASQAVEDADALAGALCRPGPVPAAFAAYEAARRPRATRVQAASRRQGDIYHLGRPAADARDLAMRLLGGAGSLARFDWLYGGPDGRTGTGRPIAV